MSKARGYQNRNSDEVRRNGLDLLHYFGEKKTEDGASWRYLSVGYSGCPFSDLPWVLILYIILFALIWTEEPLDPNDAKENEGSQPWFSILYLAVSSILYCRLDWSSNRALNVGSFHPLRGYVHPKAPKIGGRDNMKNTTAWYSGTFDLLNCIGERLRFPKSKVRGPYIICRGLRRCSIGICVSYSVDITLLSEHDA